MAQKQQVLILNRLACTHVKDILKTEGLSGVVHITDTPTFQKIEPKECNETVAILADHLFQLNKAALDKMPKLKLIVRLGVGFDNVDIQQAGAMGIAVVNIPDYATEEVADSGVSLVLNLYRQTFNLACHLRDGEMLGQEDVIRIAHPARRIRGKKLGMIGLGKIGLSLANKCKALGFTVQYFDPYINQETSLKYKTEFELTQIQKLSDLLEDSDCVVPLCPLTKDTKHIINAETIKMMKDKAFLVNVSRGGLVDETALAAALKSGKLAGAGLDVHECEPFLFEKSPLKGCENIICTPHSAFFSQESVQEMETKGCKQVSLILQGNSIDKLENCVNLNFLNKEEVEKRHK